MRALGTQVALDDFGAGISSFGEFKSLPVNTLKIDGQFARELLEVNRPGFLGGSEP